MKRIILISLILLITICSKAQSFYMDTYSGPTISTCAADFYATTSANYAANANQIITFQSNNATFTHLRVNFIYFAIDQTDTLYIYDGLSITSPLIGKYNNSNPLSGGQNTVQSTITNLSGALTFKFVSNGSIQKAGWFATFVCIKNCQRVLASLDTLLTLPKPDTNYIDLCLGDPVTFVAAENFPDNDIAYHQSINNCSYEWDFGDGSPVGNGYTVTHNFLIRKGYDVTLKVTDSMGCSSYNVLGTRVRISSKPTTTIQLLPDMCTGDTKLITVGYSPNSIIVVEPMGFTQISKQGFDSTMFIPDGPSCPPGVYTTDVLFNNFPVGATIQNATDILAICVKIEHSFAGDLGFRILCPNGQAVTLDPNTQSGVCCEPFLGIPFGGANHNPFDNGCIPANNPSGTGWNYCWSSFYPNNNTTLDQLSASMSTGTVLVNGYRVIDSTNQINHTNYIQPQNSLAGLVGCPLNGIWSIEITDDWEYDNGYIFNWTLELTANLMPGIWTYNVKIDSVGFSGSYISALNDTTAIIAPSAGGNYTYDISLVDEFGCVWDTTTTLTVITTPQPYLGSDTAICYPDTAFLDPGNIGTEYSWVTPSGIKSTQAIATTSIYATIPIPFSYILTASNFNTSNTLTCSGKDTIIITINPKPEISFSTDPPSPIVGCDPLTVKFYNESSPQNSTYIWDFGDGQTSTTESPSHVFIAGNYSIGLTATTFEGCTSFSLSSGLVTSYPKPIVDFTWTPPIGTRQNPAINFTNLTTPQDTSFSWIWDFGDGGTDVVKNPIHSYPGIAEEQFYTVTLIATTSFGCNDTMTYPNLKIIDDVLIFPNIITPNGDGINDKFEIGALIKGGGYTETQVIIYNRWGKKVYENNSYKNDFGGDGLPDGVYFVTIKAKGILKDVEYKSSLQILR